MVVETFSEKRIGDFNKDDMKGLVDIMGKWRFSVGSIKTSIDESFIDNDC